MRNAASAGLLAAGLIAGLAIGSLAFRGGGPADTAAPSAVRAGGEAGPAARLKIAGTVPASLIQVGTLGARLPTIVDAISDGRVKMQFFDPGALVPPFEVFEAVSSGSVDAGWGTAGYWIGKVPALALFSAVPFGPAAGEYMAWFYHGGGKAFYDEIYGRHDIQGVLCGVVSPEASGWFRREITSLDDLKGLKMRFFGLGAKVMEKLGVSTQLLAGGDIYPALELGTIDATEFAMPAIDRELGFHEIARHYYFPGWHQQSTFLEIIINREVWQGLDDAQQTQIVTACGESIRHSIAEGEALQFNAIKALEAAGVTMHKWPPEMLAAFEAAWREVVAEEAAADEDFGRVWRSLQDFRADYDVWRDLGYL